VKPWKLAIGVTVGALACHEPASAGPPSCYPWQSSGYCQYDGKVTRAYMNAYNQVILYFDSTFNTSIASAVGLNGVNINNAAMYNMQSNPDFGKSLFAALLAAQARGATVSVQMSSVSEGYLVMDRIWVNE
jgi:hypothetical protein